MLFPVCFRPAGGAGVYNRTARPFIPEQLRHLYRSSPGIYTGAATAFTPEQLQCLGLNTANVYVRRVQLPSLKNPDWQRIASFTETQMLAFFSAGKSLGRNETILKEFGEQINKLTICQIAPLTSRPECPNI